jgi:hypothetical protein
MLLSPATNRLLARYPFNWLDELLEVILNPITPGWLKPDPAQQRVITSRLPSELLRLKLELHARIFQAESFAQIELIIKQYLHCLDSLHQQASLNLAAYNGDIQLRDLGNQLMTALGHVREHILQRYPDHPQAPSGRTTAGREQVSGAMLKVTCRLSSDQLGILLKAADEARLLVSRSLSQVFKQIIPHLSTPHRTDLSWESMRSSSYHPEENDKQIVISVLEDLIKRIKNS